MATRTDKGILLAEELLVWLRQNNVIIPAIDVVERTCAEAMAGSDVGQALSDAHDSGGDPGSQ